MDFNDTPEEAAYRAKVRAWLAANAPDMSHLAPEERRNWHDEHKAGRRRLAGEQGRRRLRPHHLAQGMGRRGRHADPEVIFNQEEAKRRASTFAYFIIGLGMCVPT